jgi:hypothetical protein
MPVTTGRGKTQRVLVDLIINPGSDHCHARTEAEWRGALALWLPGVHQLPLATEMFIAGRPHRIVSADVTPDGLQVEIT